VEKADGNWCMCGSFFTFSNTHFRRDVSESAGGRLLPMPSSPPAGCTFKTNSDGSQNYECDSTQLQHFQTLLSQADVIFDETYVPNNAAYTLDDFSRNFKLSNSSTSLSAMTNKAVFRVDASISDPREKGGAVGNSFFEQMPAEPQQLLGDMMTALWGNAFQGTCNVKYFRNLHSGELQRINKHTDCAASCDAIHSLQPDVPQCAAQVTSSSSPETTREINDPTQTTTVSPGSSDNGTVITDDQPTSESNKGTETQPSETKLETSGGHPLAVGLGLGLGLGLPVLHSWLPMSL
jgi:hypothetical protein